MYEDLEVLVVDDFSTMRSIVRQMLSQCGINNVTECKDGAEAWNYLVDSISEPPDLVLCDLHMENMDGMQLTRKIRSSKVDNISKLPVMILTGEKERLVHDVVSQVGATSLLIKPVSVGILQKEIGSLLGFASRA